MSAVERQELLDEATPRPWHVDEDGNDGLPWIVETGAYAGRPEDTQLIVAAVNDYEALLACEAGLRAIVGFLQPASRYALHAREALEQLDRVRETS